MTSNWTKPANGRHIFVVLRFDDYVQDPIQAITGTKAFESQELADAEAARLNELNADKRARYFVRLARLQAGSSDAG